MVGVQVADAQRLEPGAEGLVVLALYDDLGLAVTVEVGDGRRGVQLVVLDDQVLRGGLVTVGELDEHRPACDVAAVGSPCVEVAVRRRLEDVEPAVADEVDEDGWGDGALGRETRERQVGSWDRRRAHSLGHDLGPPGSPVTRRVPDVGPPGRARRDHGQVSGVVEVAHGDVGHQRLVPRIDAGMSAGDGRRVGPHGPAGQLVAGRRIDGVHHAVGVAEDDVEVAPALEVDEGGLALAAGTDAVREAGQQRGVVMDEERAPVLADPARGIGDEKAQGDGVLLRRLVASSSKRACRPLARTPAAGWPQVDGAERAVERPGVRTPNPRSGTRRRWARARAPPAPSIRIPTIDGPPRGRARGQMTRSSGHRG